MNIFKRIAAVLSIGLFSVFVAGNAGAVPSTIDFGTSPIDPTPAHEEGGFRVTSSTGLVFVGELDTIGSDNEAQPNDGSGNLGFGGGASLRLVAIDGSLFDLLEFDIDVLIATPFEFTVEGNDGAVSQTFGTSGGTVGSSILSAFTSLSSVTFSANAAAFSAFATIDNIDVEISSQGGGLTEASEPGILALMGIGLIGLAALRRERRVR